MMAHHHHHHHHLAISENIEYETGVDSTVCLLTGEVMFFMIQFSFRNMA